MKNTRVVKARSTGVAAHRSRFNRKGVSARSAGFYMTDQSGMIAVASDSLAKILHYDNKEEVMGLNIAEKLYETKSDRGEFLKKLAQEGHIDGYPVKMVRKDGTRVVLSARSTLLCDENGEPVGVEGILEEVAAEMPAVKSGERHIPDLEPLDHSAAVNFDGSIKEALTGLYNYQYFMNSLDTEIRRVERIFHPTCLMMIDLDNFAAFNEKNGREQGDQLLKIVASLLKKSLRTSDIVCRQSQDQFLALLSETTRDEALALAKTLKDAVQSALADKNITCSIGLSRFIIGMTVQEFFLQANLGLYMAKEAGKNEACLYG
ncbi:MAG: sensor domain-containing diguanylate cyclase [Candidatus Omnitrophica bacterium]|nr:sensor domain-containing diguanylate cyclase [Candidatus Omnitrophota bacterium]